MPLRAYIRPSCSGHWRYRSALTFIIAACVPPQGSSVRVVPLPDAPDIAVPADIRLPSEARAATLQASNASCPGVGSSGGGAGSGGALAGVRRRRGWEESTAGFSGLPGWTWRLFDPYAIAVRTQLTQSASSPSLSEG